MSGKVDGHDMTNQSKRKAVEDEMRWYKDKYSPKKMKVYVSLRDKGTVPIQSVMGGGGSRYDFEQDRPVLGGASNVNFGKPWLRQGQTEDEYYADIRRLAGGLGSLKKGSKLKFGEWLVKRDKILAERFMGLR